MISSNQLNEGIIEITKGFFFFVFFLLFLLSPTAHLFVGGLLSLVLLDFLKNSLENQH
jgi:hypothetical protein